MAINVQYGGQGGTTAGQIIAQAGQANLQREQQQNMLSQQLQQQREMQLVQIGAQADMQREAADKAFAQTALQHGLQGELQEQMFDQTVQKMQEGAKLEAQQFDYQFTAKQRQQIAAYNNARQTISGSDNFSPDEKKLALQQIDLEQANIKPQSMPSNKYKWPTINGQQSGLGVPITLSGGATVIGELDANGNPKFGKLEEFQNTEKGITLQKQLEAESKRADKEQAGQNIIQKSITDNLFKLFSEPITYPTGQKDADGGDILGSRPRTPAEVQKIMQGVMGLLPGAQGQQQQPQQQGQSDESPEAVIQQAMANPELLRDPSFRARVITARQALGQ